MTYLIVAYAFAALLLGGFLAYSLIQLRQRAEIHRVRSGGPSVRAASEDSG